MSDVRSSDSSAIPPTAVRGWRALFAKEDWWAIWIGLGLVIAAAILFQTRTSLVISATIAFDTGTILKWLAVTPQKWSTLSEAGIQLGTNSTRYLSLLLWLVLFGIGVKSLGLRLAEFVPAFAIVFVISALIYTLGAWDQASRYNLEPPLVALLLGLLIANTVRLPNW